MNIDLFLKKSATSLALIFMSPIIFGCQATIFSSGENKIMKNDQINKIPFAIVTMVSPDAISRQRLTENMLSKWGCKYNFISNKNIVQSLISNMKSNLEISDAKSEIAFDARYKIEFNGEFLSQENIVFGPGYKKNYFTGFFINKLNSNDHKFVYIKKDFFPILFEYIKKSDTFENYQQECDASVMKYSKGKNK